MPRSRPRHTFYSVASASPRLALHLARHADTAWREVIRPWLEAGAGRLDPAHVIVPTRGQAQALKQRCLRENLPLLPLTIDPSGVWFRPEGRFYIGGTTPAEGNDPPAAPLEVQHEEWDEMVWPVLAERVPAFEAAKVVNSWAGYYEYNTFDQNGIVGRHPAIDSLIFATGFSGHGIQQSPAVGRAVAELIVHGDYRTLNLSPFGYERISAGRPVRELNVV